MVVLAAAILTGLVLYAQRVVAENFSSASDSIESAQVTVGSISTTVSGSGTLASEGVEDVTFPQLGDAGHHLCGGGGHRQRGRPAGLCGLRLRPLHPGGGPGPAGRPG
ncbi:MAG: hypothetical protein LUD82_10070 [Clostridiales bacterium]|nr:hypothetical protein [Clostridiales bacterium]